MSQGILTSAKLIMFMWYTYIILLQSLAANKAYDKLDMTIEDALRNREIVSDIWSVVSFRKRGLCGWSFLFFINLQKVFVTFCIIIGCHCSFTSLYMAHCDFSRSRRMRQNYMIFLDMPDCDDCDCRKKSRWLHVWEPILWVKS